METENATRQIDLTSKDDGITARIHQYLPRLFAIWLLITVLGPHQDLYKIFFHGVVTPAILVLLYRRQTRINWLDPLLIAALILTVYASLATFFVGVGPFRDHFRAFRWGVETFFCLMAFYLWLPGVLKKPDRWGHFFMLIALLGALSGFALMSFGLISGRISGLGVLHNPIQASSILIIYLATGYYLTFMRPQAHAPAGSIWLMILSMVLVSLFVLMSQSRAPIFALAVFFVFPAGHLLSRMKYLYGAAILITGVGIVAGVISQVYGLGNFVDLLLLRGWSYRLDIWQGYLAYPPDSWLFGFGAGTAPSMLQAAKEVWEPAGIPVTHAHNLWLGTLVRTGVIGLALLLFMAGLLFKSSLTVSPYGYWRTGRIMLLLLVFLLTLTGSQTLISSIKAIWIIGWLPLLVVWFSEFSFDNSDARM